jgi:hypothetical protein
MVFLSLPLMAQDAEEEQEGPEQEIPINPDWANYTPFMYSKGDQLFAIAPMFVFPIVFTNSAGTIEHNLSVIGIGLSLRYARFLSQGFFIGGEVGAIGITSKAQNWLYLVPFGVTIGYQITLHRTQLPLFLRRFEFPFSLMAGGVVTSYLNNEENYLGFFLKAGTAAFFRFNQDWSFGINVDWWWVPQWTKDKAKDVYGNFFEFTVTARYHF